MTSLRGSFIVAAALFASSWASNSLARGATSFPAVAARWPVDPTLDLPVCMAAGSQVVPKVCSDDAGGAIVVWDDYRSGQGDVYVQRVAEAGVPVWNPDGVPLAVGPGNQTQSAICSDGSRGAFIAWTDDRPGPSQIRIQRVRADGTVRWPVGGVDLRGNPLLDTPPALAPDGAGGAYLAWTDVSVTPGADCLVAQHVDSAGVPLWADAGVIVRPGGVFQHDPVLVPDMVGGVMVFWIDTGPTPGEGHDEALYGQRLNAGGVLQWSPDGLALAPGNQVLPRAIPDGFGGAIVSWTDLRFGSPIFIIFCQRVTAGGVALWTPGGLPLSTPSTLQDRGIPTSDGAGGAIIAWHETRPGDGTGDDIYAQHVSEHGVPQWTSNGVPVCTASEGQIYATICGDGACGAIIAWEDHRAGAADVYAQQIDSSGNPGSVPNGVPVCTAAGAQELPQLVASPPGHGIIVWSDRRLGDSNIDIYAQRVPYDGVVSADVPDGAALSLEGPLPNPVTDALAVTVSLPGSVPASLDLFDVGGRLVSSRDVGGLGEGRHLVAVAGPRMLRPGVYLLRLSSGSRTIVKRVAVAR